MKKFLIGLSVIAAILVIINIIGYEKKDKSSINNNKKIEELKLHNSDENFIKLELYFDSSKDEEKVEVAKEERLIIKEEFIGELIMQELIKGPSVKSKLKSIFPKQTRLLSFSIKEGTAYVNLSSEAKSFMTPAKEEVYLKSIVLSLTELESIKKVKILIDNKNVDSLGGNFNISKSLDKNDVRNIGLLKK